MAKASESKKIKSPAGSALAERMRPTGGTLIAPSGVVRGERSGAAGMAAGMAAGASGATTPQVAGPAGAKPGPHAYGPPVVVEVMVKVQALAFREADGGYSVVVPELPGCFTEGDTIEDVSEMVKEAAEGWLACQHDYHRDSAIRATTEPMPSERGARA